MKNTSKMFKPLLWGILLLIFALVGQAPAQTWSLTGSLSTPRYSYTASPLPDGRVLVSGGADHGSNPVASAEIYDPALGTWSLTGSLSAARRFHTASPLPDGRVLVSGGFGDFLLASILASAEIYDPALGTWSLTGSMSTARYLPTHSPLPDGRVLVSGGVGNGDTLLASAEIYDPALGTWSITGSLSTPRHLHTASPLPDGRVLVSGGVDGSSILASALASAEIYDPALGTWSITGSLSTPRYFHTASPLPDDRVLVSGGANDRSILASAEIYDPALGTWSITGSLSTPRYSHTASQLPDDRVLVSGGLDGETLLARADIYDPALGTWSITGSLSTPRYSHTASQLPDGRVLVSGGLDGSSAVLASAEIFDSDAGATPPQISCGAPDGVWHNSNVTIACKATDPESGLADPAEASFNLLTSVLAGVETSNAATNSRQICNTVGGCTVAGPINGNKVDRRAPTNTITSPANTTYQLNASVAASYACVDNGSGLNACQGPVGNGSPIDTSSTGTKTFTVSSTDNVGNTSSTSVTYGVASGGSGGGTSADLGITMAAAPNVSPGATLTYSITITNGSKTTATGVVISDALPAGTVFASAATSQGTVAAPPVGSNGIVTANLGSLANNSKATVSIVVTVSASAAGSTLANTATVTATTQDLNNKNNSATQKTQVTKK